MNFYRHLLVLLGSSLAATLLVVGTINLFSFGSPPLARRSIAPFPKEELTLVKRESPPVTGLKSPFGSSAPSHSDFPRISLSEAVAGASVREFESAIRMVLIQEGRRLALINGKIVKEGDVVDKQRVVRIEKDRVLLKVGNNGEKWVTLMQEKGKELTSVEARGKAGAETGPQSNVADDKRG
jgi:hypothetical protein